MEGCDGLARGGPPPAHTSSPQHERPRPRATTRDCPHEDPAAPFPEGTTLVFIPYS